LLKQFASIEQEMTSLQRITHDNVVSYVGLFHTVYPNYVKLFVLEDFLKCNDLSFHLSEGLPVEVDLLRHYARGILQAVAFMHSQNVVHRDLRDTSVFVSSTGLVKVQGFSIDRRVRDLLQETKDTKEEEKFPLVVGRGAKKGDVYRFGLLILSLALGQVVPEASIPRSLSEKLGDFLRKALHKDERERWSAAQLLEHTWLFESPPREPMIVARQGSKDEGISPDVDKEEDEPEAVPFVQVGTGQSRLQSEFCFISHIGKGGFGEVMKVKNILDGQVYAIKKIKLNQANKAATKKLMREVKLLSRLNNENVVRYYTSWIEVTTISEEKKEAETSTSNEDPSSSAFFKQPKRKIVSTAASAVPAKPSILDGLKLGPRILPDLPDDANIDVSISFSSMFPGEGAEMADGDDDDDDEDEENGEDFAFGTSFLPHSDDGWEGEEDEDSDGGVAFEASSSSVLFEESSQGADNKVDSRVSPQPSGEDPGKEKKLEIRMMYIQMEYCDKQTLRDAIDGGLYRDTQRVWRMFRVK
jgi:translation initiation factor 2-alpha kinase 4